MIITEQEQAIYDWIDACPEACLSYKESDNTIVIEIKLEEHDS